MSEVSFVWCRVDRRALFPACAHPPHVWARRQARSSPTSTWHRLGRYRPDSCPRLARPSESLGRLGRSACGTGATVRTATCSTGLKSLAGGKSKTSGLATGLWQIRRHRGRRSRHGSCRTAGGFGTTLQLDSRSISCRACFGTPFAASGKQRGPVCKAEDPLIKMMEEHRKRQGEKEGEERHRHSKYHAGMLRLIGQQEGRIAEAGRQTAEARLQTRRAENAQRDMVKEIKGTSEAMGKTVSVLGALYAAVQGGRWPVRRDPEQRVAAPRGRLAVAGPRGAGSSASSKLSPSS